MLAWEEEVRTLRTELLEAADSLTSRMKEMEETVALLRRRIERLEEAFAKVLVKTLATHLGVPEEEVSRLLAKYLNEL
jgi:uncharacterized protein with PIN domain